MAFRIAGGARSQSHASAIHKSLNTACPENVPQAVSKQLQSHYYANAAHNLLLAGELLKILRLFEGHNVPAIPYKGPVLAASIYGNVTFREFADLDILVRERDYDRAQHLLISQDFRLGACRKNTVGIKNKMGNPAAGFRTYRATRAVLSS